MLYGLISLILIFVAYNEGDPAILACAAVFACAGAISSTKGE